MNAPDSKPRGYSTAVEGGAPVRQRFVISGRMVVRDYVDFVAERARWLSISGWIAVEDRIVTLVAAGPEALVGALEMACTLGPLNALVESIETRDEPGPVAAGFEIRS